jgi:hypothetical protein
VDPRGEYFEVGIRSTRRSMDLLLGYAIRPVGMGFRPDPAKMSPGLGYIELEVLRVCQSLGHVKDLKAYLMFVLRCHC